MVRRGYLLVFLALLLVPGWLFLRGADPSASAQPAFAGITLVDQDGAGFDAARLQGHWTLMLLGYTHCPDVCPLTLALLQQVKRSLTEQGAAELQVLFVSVDPERDPPARLKQYVTHFDPDFIAATGEPTAIRALERRLGTYHRFDPPHPDGGYTVQHSAYLYLIDPQGRLHARLAGPHRPEAVVQQYLALRRAYRG